MDALEERSIPDLPADPASDAVPRAGGTGEPLVVSMAMADYDRTRPILDGRVTFEGISPRIVTADIATFCKRPVYEEFDVAEMSLSWYVAARCRGEPVIGLPIFPLRMPVFAYMFCRADAPFQKPSDLVGKRVGSIGYRYTVNLWLRGILADHYGLSPRDLTWVTGEREGAGFVVPEGINVEVVEDRSYDELLLSGEIDAIFSPEIPPSFLRGDPRVRRLFPDASGEQARYFSHTGIFPITHVVVTGERFIARHQWVAESLMKGFRSAQKIIDDYYSEPKNLSFPDGIFMVESTRKAYGEGLWSHGLDANRANLEAFVRYAYEQGYIDRKPPVDYFFAAHTLEL